MAATIHCISTTWNFTPNLPSLSLNPKLNTSPIFKPLSFSSNLFSQGVVSVSPVQRVVRRSVVCEAAPTKKADSAAGGVIIPVKTRMKKVLEALEVLRKKPDAQPEEVIPVEKLIAEAYSAIDKAVKVRTLHRNTGARRKSRLARRKKAVEIHHGWYTPDPTPANTA
ncbi:hypothetical protein Leryth_015113 [Lithospermum erythrorhizon]|nr:hypothetical protein Leryth_015113 [Lithospermum erythrorhizon]